MTNIITSDDHVQIDISQDHLWWNEPDKDKHGSDLDHFFVKHKNLKELYSNPKNVEEYVNGAIALYRFMADGREDHYARIKYLEESTCPNVSEKYKSDIAFMVRGLYVDKKAQVIGKELQLNKHITLDVLEQIFEKSLATFLAKNPDRAEGYELDMHGGGPMREGIASKANMADVEKKSMVAMAKYLEEYITQDKSDHPQTDLIFQTIDGIPAMKELLLETIISFICSKNSNKREKYKEVARKSRLVQNAISEAKQHMAQRKEARAKRLAASKKNIANTLEMTGG